MKRETGFPSPAQGYEANSIDLNILLIKNRAATFFMHMSGQSLEGRGIFDGDILVIDRAVPLRAGKLIVFQYENNFYCRELRLDSKGPFFKIGEEERRAIVVFGTVTSVIRKL
ncbi:MAG: S24 family peptidase [Spirochaetales bacterium]|nr:S24 family peptidase [Spirochaetales bacterium]